jgi:hypothetical protein
VVGGRGFSPKIADPAYRYVFFSQFSSSFSIPLYTEKDVQAALSELRDNPKNSLLQITDYFNILRTTLRNRLLKTHNTKIRYKKQQLLDSVEELRLVIYIS